METIRVKCYKCNQELTSLTSSNEHIIPNACGGRLKSKNLLCRKCNISFGENFDNELTFQTNPLANLLSIKRDRGEPQPFKVKIQKTEETLDLANGGIPMLTNPIINQKIDSNSVQISVKARSIGEFKKILEGLKKKYPDQIDFDKELKKAINIQEFISEPIELQLCIGGKETFKSITKIAINFYIFKGGERKFILNLLDYLDGIIDLEIVSMHFTLILNYLMFIILLFFSMIIMMEI